MESFLLRCDYLGDRISILYKNRSSHQNWFGGLLTILIGTLSIAVSIYFTLELVERRNPKSYLLSKFTDNAGKITLGSNQINHYLNLKTFTSQPVKFDKKAMNIIGIVINQNYQIFGSYLYDKCDFDLDFQNIKYLFTNQIMREEIEQSICPRVYISPEGKEFKKSSTNSSETGFIDPYMEFGMTSLTYEPLYYVLKIQKCTNSSLNNNSCYPLNQINNLYTNTFFTLKFIDNYFDVINYTQPVTKFVNSVKGVIGPNFISNNWLNFLQVNISTQNGLMFDNFSTQEAYKFDYRVEFVANVESSQEILNIQFSLQNMSQFYNRSYTKLQDVFANIGGIFKFLVLSGYFINSLLDKFQRHLDWAALFDKMMKFDSKLESIKVENNQNPNINRNFKDVSDYSSVNVAIQKDENKLTGLQSFRGPLNVCKFFCNKAIRKQHFIDEIKKCVEIMLDERNLFKIHFDIIKMKKFLLYDDKKMNNFENFNVTFDDIIDSNFYK